jgi:hypothetical protein
MFKGFRLLRLPLAPGSPLARSLLVKRHEARDVEEKAAASRTLFVTHLDDFSSELQLSKCFDAFGVVERVVLKAVDKKASKLEQRADRVSMRVVFARVIFKEKDSLEKALAAANGNLATGAILPLPASMSKQRKFAALQKGSAYRDPVELRKETDAWMASYDEREDARIREQRESAVDEDGFVKVVSGITRTEDGAVVHSAKRPSLKTGVFNEPIVGMLDPSLHGDARHRKKKQGKEKLDFYRFQLRERRRDEVITFRKRKAEDAEKLDAKTKRFRFMAKIDGDD